MLNQFGERLGRAWCETDEEDTDYRTLIRHLLEGQYSNPVRVVGFNTAEAGPEMFPMTWRTSCESAAPTAEKCPSTLWIF